MPEAEGHPRQAGERGLALAERAAQLARLWGFAFAGFTLVALITWPFVEGRVSREEQIIGDLVLVLALFTGAVTAALALRRTAVHVEYERRLQAEDLARRDELSGLFNFRHFREHLHRGVADAAVHDSTLALILLDLDNFKDVNDRFGHVAGDAVIAAIGAAIRDVARDAGIAARQGGDEFSILLPGHDRTTAEFVALAAASAVAVASRAATPRNSHIAVTASYGIAVYPHDAADAESLTAAADRALYRAKGDAAEERERSSERASQEVFFSIGAAIGRSLDPNETVANICDAVGVSLNVDAAAIWIAAGDDTLAARAYYAVDESFVERWMQIRLPMRRADLVNSGLLKGQHVYVDDIRSGTVLPSPYRETFDDGMWMAAAPIIGSDGMIAIAAKHERAAPPEPGLVLAIAQLVGAAIRNADVYQRARRQADKVASLAGLGGLLVGQGDYETQLGAVVRRIVDVTGFDMVTCDTGDPADEKPFLRSFHGRGLDGGEFDEASAELWKSMRPALTEPSVADFLAKATEPIVMLDPVNQVPPIYRDAIESSGTRTVVVMPVTWQGELNGLIYFGSYRSNAFDPQDIALMQTIAAQLAPAIQVANLHVQLERSYADLKGAHLHALLRLAYAAEARDPYTECHLQRIRAVSLAIGERMGFEGDDLEALGYGAIVHDLGKLRIPDSILINPGALSDDEWTQMKQHPRWGADIIGENAFYDVARTVALNHHERWDGSGYPNGLAGEDIPLAARIVAVADVYDALTSARPYKAAWPVERALVEIVRMRGKTLCPVTVDVFMDLWREGEIARIDADTADESMEFDFRSLYAA